MPRGLGALSASLLLFASAVTAAAPPQPAVPPPAPGNVTGGGTPGSDPDENLVLAIVLSLAAGLATCIGGLAVFIPQIRSFGMPRVLSASLALSSGVMLYVSFVEIFVKSNDAITLAISGGYVIHNGTDADGEAVVEETLGFTYPGHALGNLYTTIAFFGGMFVVVVLEKIVHMISPGVHDHSITPRRVDFSASAVSPAMPPNKTPDTVDTYAPRDSGTQLSPPAPPPTSPGEAGEGAPPAPQDGGQGEKKAADMPEGGNRELRQMGLLTALALGLHNFPEGFATFIATLQEPALGAALCVAIAIHNIPEGLCVAMPVYYATGSKWKALGWCALSGVSEPIGGILGWAVLRSVFTDGVFGAAFGAVGGMMVFIVLHELLPTALKNDPKNERVSIWLVIGMVVISASLLIFGFA